MATLTSFFIHYTFEKWFDILAKPCEKCFGKYYNAQMLQKKYDWDDIYQEAWEITLEKIRKGKMTFENDGVKGNNRQLRFKLYFFSLYKNLVLNKYEKLDGGKIREVAIEDEILEWEDEDLSEEEMAKQKKISLMWAAFDKLGDKCKEIIRACHLGSGKMSGKEIADEFDYRTPKIAHKNVDKCRARLKELYYKLLSGS